MNVYERSSLIRQKLTNVHAREPLRQGLVLRGPGQDDRAGLEGEMPLKGSRATLRCIQATCSPTGSSGGGGASWGIKAG